MTNTDNSTLRMLAEIKAANAKSAFENLQQSRQPLASTNFVKAAQQAPQAKLQTEKVASKKKVVALDADSVAFEDQILHVVQVEPVGSHIWFRSGVV